jgi:hypothetical protein
MTKCINHPQKEAVTRALFIGKNGLRNYDVCRECADALIKQATLPKGNGRIK